MIYEMEGLMGTPQKIGGFDGWEHQEDFSIAS